MSTDEHSIAHLGTEDLDPACDSQFGCNAPVFFAVRKDFGCPEVWYLCEPHGKKQFPVELHYVITCRTHMVTRNLQWEVIE